jgi:hypothetical protein
MNCTIIRELLEGLSPDPPHNPPLTVYPSSHVAQVMRRLRRICAAVGSESMKTRPWNRFELASDRRVQFVSCSATIANPLEHMRNVFGVEVLYVPPLPRVACLNPLAEHRSCRGRRGTVWLQGILGRDIVSSSPLLLNAL